MWKKTPFKFPAGCSTMRTKWTCVSVFAGKYEHYRQLVYPKFQFYFVGLVISLWSFMMSPKCYLTVKASKKDVHELEKVMQNRNVRLAQSKRL